MLPNFVSMYMPAWPRKVTCTMRSLVKAGRGVARGGGRGEPDGMTRPNPMRPLLS